MTTAIDDLSGRAVPWQGVLANGGGPGAPGNVFVNTARVDLYVSDINGNDANDGLAAATPVKTLAGALSKIMFQIVAFDVVIHVGAHGGAGYTWATIDGYTLIDGASIYVVGDGAGQPGEDGFTVVVGPTLALAGSDDTKVVSAALVADAYFGNTIEMLTGAAAGDRRTIKENTATDILAPMRFTAAVAAGDSYRIVRPSVRVLLPRAYTFASPVGSTTIMCVNIGGPIVRTTDVGMADSGPRSSLMLVNLGFDTVAGGFGGYSCPEFVNSLVRLFGVEYAAGFITSSGELAMGLTNKSESGAALAGYVVAELPALLASSTSWLGWGLAHVNATTTAAVYLSGEGYRQGIYTGRSLAVDGGFWEFLAGRLSTTSVGLSVGAGRAAAQCKLGSYGAVQTRYLGVTIEATNTAIVFVSARSRLFCPSLGPTAPLKLLSSAAITALLADFGAEIDITSGHNYAGGVVITTLGWGAWPKHGSRIFVDHDMTGGITATLGAMTLDGVVAISAADLAGVAKFATAADGSAIISAD